MRGVVPNASGPLVYVIDQDEAVRDSLKALIESNGFCVRDFSTREGFLSDTEPNAGTCLVLSFTRYGAETAKSLRALREHRPGLPIILVVGQGDISSRADARKGAFAQLERPIQEATLIHTIQSAGRAADSR